VFRVLRALWNFAADRDDMLGRNPVSRLREQWYPVPKREGLVKGDQLAPFQRAVVALPNGAETPVLDWRERLVCSKCGSRQIDMVVTGARRSRPAKGAG
jgi:hypothetical protein